MGKNSVVVVDVKAADYGLTETKAADIKKMFVPMLDKMEQLEGEYNAIVNSEINEETATQARELRLRYVKVRTATKDIHKQLKAFYLQGGRFVDGWKNAQELASTGKEEKLKEIEEFEERREAERLTKLQAERRAEIKQYNEDCYIPENLCKMPEETYKQFLLGIKTQYEQAEEARKLAEEEEKKRREEEARIEAEKEAERKAEEERKEKERLRLAAENEKLKKEQEKERARVEAQMKKEEAKRKAEAKKREAEQKKKDAILAEALAKSQKLEEERKERIKAEREAQERREAEQQAELKKGDAQKVEDLISDLEALKTKYTFKAKETKGKYKSVGHLLDKVIIFINEK